MLDGQGAAVVLECRGDRDGRKRRSTSPGTEVLYVVFASLLAPLCETIPSRAFRLQHQVLIDACPLETTGERRES